ncbi:MAG TPA: RHS repeat-associated core domain-containing protein, partial [Kofleriaceae bacterium]|nr:RHS repeat-associated core domain-containing protein [Kofleriaceae bacterium]
MVYAAGAGSSILARQTLGYGATDEVAVLTSSLSGLPNRTASFDYDQRHQLIEASDDRGFSGHYEYGVAGRLTAVTVAASNAPDAHPRDVDYAYDSDDPEAVTRLVMPPSGKGKQKKPRAVAEYVYDDSGNVIRRSECEDLAGTCNTYQTSTFRYDGDIRQRSVTNAHGITETYFYDPAGQRVLSVQKDTATGAYQQARYWFGETELWYAPDGTQSKSWVHISHGGPVARLENGTDLEFTYHNALGHLLVSVAPDGTPTGGFNYGPFGEILDAIGDPDEHLKRFNGKDADKVSGLNYYGYRYYDPLSLTWSQADPMYRFLPDAAWSEPRRANLYVFSGNNPMS